MKMILNGLVVLCLLLTGCVAAPLAPEDTGMSAAEPVADAHATHEMTSSAAITETEGMTATEELTPTAASTAHEAMSSASVSVPFAAVQVIQDFAPGSWSPVHSHGGPVLATVIEGEITLHQEATGEEIVYGPGDFWTEDVGQIHMAGNEGQENVRVAVVFLLPEGAKQTIVQESPNTKDAPAPTVISRTSMSITESLGSFAAIQVIQDFAPGSWSPVHSHGGPVLVTVLEGHVTVRQEATGADTVYGPGDFWTEEVGQVHMAGNEGQENVRVVVLFLLPEGADLTTVQASPNTKDAPGPTVISRTTMSVTTATE